MDVLYLLIPVSVLLVFVIGIVFWWSIRHGQFEDMDGPAYRVIMDDDTPLDEENKSGKAGRDGDVERESQR